MKTQIIFQDVCPQQFVGDIDHVLSSTIVTRLEQVPPESSAPCIIMAEENLSTFINHLKLCEAPVKNLLLKADNEQVALIGLESRIRTQYQGHIIDARKGKLNQYDLRIAKLKLAPSRELKRLTRSVLYYMLRSYPLISIEDAVNTVCEANDSVTRRWAFSAANWFIRDIEKQLTLARTLTVPESLLLKPSDISLDDYMQGGTFLNFSSTGAGKTQLNEKLVPYFIRQGLTVAYVSHRCSIAEGSLTEEENISHYMKIKLGTEHSIKCLNIVVNSITKNNFKAFFNNVDVVILEEGKQVFEHVAVGSVNHREQVYTELIKLCEQAKVLIVSDADLNNSTLDVIKRARPRQPVRYLYQSMDFSQKCIDISAYDNVLAEIEATVGQEPVMVCSDNRRLMNELAASFREKDLRVLTITKDDAKEDEQQLFFQSPDDVLHKYDVVLYSPAITSSTSITKDRFAKHFGLFEGTVCSSTIIQMLRRNRPCMQFTVGIKAPNIMNEDRLDELLSDEVTDFEAFTAQVTRDINFNTNNIVPALYFNAQAQGFKVTFNGCSTEVFKPTQTEIKTFERSLSIEKFQRGIEETSGKGSKQKNIEQWYFTDARERMEETLCKTDITLVDVKFWYKNNFEQKLNNFIKLMENDRLFKRIFEIIGIDKYTGEGQVTKLDAVKLYAELSKRKVEFDQKIQGMTLSKNLKDPTNTVNKIIKMFGFEVKRCQLGEKNNKVRVSYLSSDSVAYMHDCWDRRKFKKAA